MGPSLTREYKEKLRFPQKLRKKHFGDTRCYLQMITKWDEIVALTAQVEP
jgi:hypothetical protein